MSIEYTKDELESAVLKAYRLSEVEYPEYLSQQGRDICILGAEVLKFRQATFVYCDDCGWNTKDPVDKFCYRCEWEAMLRVLRDLTDNGNEAGSNLELILNDARSIIAKHGDLVLLPVINKEK